MAKQQKYPTPNSGKMAGGKTASMPKKAPSGQTPPTEAKPVRQRYQQGGGC